MVAWYPGGPRSSVSGPDDSEVNGDIAELGVQAEPVGLVYWAKVVGALCDDGT
jgi:hypothetical protein